MNNTHIDLTAYHEAAHAIVGLCQEQDVKEVLVSMADPGNGLCSYYPRKPELPVKAMPGNVMRSG